MSKWREALHGAAWETTLAGAEKGGKAEADVRSLVSSSDSLATKPPALVKKYV